MRLLADLREHLAARPSEPLPAGLALELRQALDAHAAGASLDAVLAAGDRRRALSALQRAGELLAPDRGQWARAERIAAAVTRLRSHKPRTEAEACVAFAIECWPAMPTCARRLFEALRY